MLQAGLDFTNDDWDCTVGILEKLQKLEMIQVCDGIVTVINWKKRQESYTTSAERMKLHRERKKNVTSDLSHSDARREENRIEEKRRDTAPETVADDVEIIPEPSERKKVKVEITELPDWLDKESWSAWVAHRVEIRKKLTPQSIKLQIRFLGQHQANHRAIIENSVKNGWTGLFPLDAVRNGTGKQVANVWKTEDRSQINDFIKRKTQST